MSSPSPNRWRQGRPDKALRVLGVKPFTASQVEALRQLARVDGLVMSTRHDYERGRVSARVAYALEVRGLVTVYVQHGGDKRYTVRIREAGRQALAVLDGACCVDCQPTRTRCS